MSGRSRPAPTWTEVYADIAEAFPHFSDPALLSRESDDNKLALWEQAARLRERREASFARAAYLAFQAAQGVDKFTKEPITLQQLASNYPEMEW